MELKLVSGAGQNKSESVSASDKLFGREYNESLVHQLLIAYLSNARGGNRAQKDRSEVNKSTHKPWRQKGTGRARSGTAASPIWRGGGRVFPNSPDENFNKKVNRKMYRAGMSVILSQLAREERLVVTEDFVVDAPKTKVLSEKLKNLEMEEVMIIVDQLDDNLLLSSRNLPRVRAADVKSSDPVSLLKFDKVLITSAALKKFEELYA